MSFRKSAKNQKGERLGFKGGCSCDQYYQIDYIELKNLRSYDFSQKDLNHDQCTTFFKSPVQQIDTPLAKSPLGGDGGRWKKKERNAKFISAV